MLFSRPRKGPVAEWLGRALQKLPQRFESALDLTKKVKPLQFVRVLLFIIESVIESLIN